MEDNDEKWNLPRSLKHNMRTISRDLRKYPTNAEEILWQAIRGKQLSGRKFRRQVAIGAFVVDFYCPQEKLAIEVDGSIHDSQQEQDQIRQELIESLGIRFVRVKNDEVENSLDAVLSRIQQSFNHKH